MIDIYPEGITDPSLGQRPRSQHSKTFRASGQRRIINTPAAARIETAPDNSSYLSIPLLTLSPPSSHLSTPRIRQERIFKP